MRKPNAAHQIWECLRTGATRSIRELTEATDRPESTIRKAARRLDLMGFIRRTTEDRRYVFRRVPKRDWGGKW